MRHLLLCLAAVAVAAADSSSGAAAEAERLLKAGDYPAARKTALDAAGRLAPGAEPKLASDLLNTAGAAAIYQGDYPEALRLLERSLTLARQAGSVEAEVLRLNNLGGLYVFLGDYGSAYSRYQQALAPAAQAPLRARQLTLSNLAALYLQLGQTQRALESYQALQATQAAVAPDVQAQTLANLAVTLRRLGDPYKARATLDQAEALLARSPNVAVALYLRVNRGIIEALDFQNYPTALAIFGDSAALAAQRGLKREAVLDRLFLAETLLRMGRHQDALAPLRESLAEAQRLRLADEEWTAWFGLGRAQRALHSPQEALRSFESAVAVIESERSQLALSSLKSEFLASKRDVYDAIVELLLAQSQPSPAAVFRWIEGARARNLKDRLPAGSPTTLDAVQARLPEGTALAVYWAGPSTTAAVWLTRRQAGILRRPEPAFPAVDQLSRALSTRDPHWTQHAAQAGQALLTASFPQAGVRHWIVVPDGSIHRIPFEVLPGPDGARLLERYEVSYLPSAYFVLVPRQARASRPWPWQRTVSIFADPDSPPPGASGLFPAAEPSLPHTVEEAQRIAAALPGRNRVFRGADNRKSHVFSGDVAASPVVHFATHATADTQDARNSRLVFSGSDPGARYLFLGDVQRLHWPGVDLVTLAACETEKGQYVRGEGVESFSRAFLAAGARSAMSSLWRVPDAPTSRFMAEFYGHLAAGRTKASALRQTKLALLRQGAHPHLWAAFLLSGDAESAVPLPWPWQGPALVLAALAGVVAWRRSAAPAAR